MSNEISITTIGHLTADPELRYTQSGLAVVSLTIAQTARSFDKATNGYVDGDTVFLRGSAWREQAEHIASSLRKGQRVIATGTLKQRSYDDPKTGEKRTAFELDIAEIGASLRYGTSVFTKSVSANQDAAGTPPVASAAPTPQATVAAPAPQAAAPAAQPVLEVQF